MRGLLLVLMGLLAAGPGPSGDSPGPASTPPRLEPLRPLSPLTADEQTALDSAIDGRDHQESAFAALVSALSRVQPARIDVASLPSWPPERFDAAVAEPDDHRGAQVLLSGRLEQSVTLERPWSEYQEWFVRIPGGGAVAVYVPGEDDLPAGEYVQVAGRFYKRVEATARDGEHHRYPAFVGRAVAAAPAGNPALLIVILVVGLLLGWLLLQVIARRAKASRVLSGSPGLESAEEDGDSTGLPSDPIAALDELARRSDDQGRKADS